MTVGDLNSHLRLAGIINPKQVLAVIMETTGDISVLRADQDKFEIELTLFVDVRDAALYLHHGQGGKGGT